MEFSIEKEICQTPKFTVAIFKLRGILDQSSLKLFEVTVHEAYHAKINRVIFNLAQLASINSSGIGLLINIAHQAQIGGGAICFIQVPQKFKLMFELLGLESRFLCYPDKESAITSWK